MAHDKDLLGKDGLTVGSEQAGPREQSAERPAPTMLGALASLVGPAVLQRKIQRRLAQRKPAEGRPSPDAASASGRGTEGTLPTEVLQKMERSLGSDFSDVKVFQDSPAATAVSARAYASGNEVHFAPGEFDPSSQAGQELIGHELGHVVQQRHGRASASVQGKDAPIVDEPALEREADEMGRQAARGQAAVVSTPSAGTATSTGVAVQRAPSGEGKGSANSDRDPKNAPLPLFADDKLRSVDELPIDVMGALIAQSVKNGPQGVTVGGTSYFVLVEGSSVVGWMRAAELPEGAFRLRSYWIVVRGNQVEVGHRYPEDTASNQEHLGTASKLLGIQPDPKITERRIAAAHTINGDIEAFLAQGMSLCEARAATLKTANEVLQTMILGTAIIVASFPFSAGPEIAGARTPGRGGNTPAGREPGDTGVTDGQAPKKGGASQNATWKSGEPLPAAATVEIDAAKFENYSMDAGNLKNGGKWKAFEALGYDVHATAGRQRGAAEVITQLRRELATTPAQSGKTSAFGPRFEVRVPIRGPNGKLGTLVTVWQQDSGSATPRLITNWLEVHE